MSAFRDALQAAAGLGGRRGRALTPAGERPLWHADVGDRLAALARLSTTLGHGAGEATRRRPPRGGGRRMVALAGAALLCGTLLAAGVTHGDATRAFATTPPAPPRRVAPIIFDGEPDAGVAVDAELPLAPTTLETRFQELR